jgi:uncharacterized protein YbbK (DUF523 family)
VSSPFDYQRPDLTRLAPSSGARVVVGVSACLLGCPVRWDGGEKLERALVERIADPIVLVPICPEVDLEMGVPREPIQLIRVGSDTRLRGVDSETDHTDTMQAYALHTAEDFRTVGASGFILKSESPSCGPSDVGILDERGEPAGSGVGMFADLLSMVCPGLPMANETELSGQDALNRFLERVFAYHRRILAF